MWFSSQQLYFSFNPARLCICPACINVSRCAWAHLFPLLLLSQPVRWSSAATHQQRERNKEAETDQLPFETLNQFPSHRHQSPASSGVYRYEIFRLSLQLPRSSNIHPLKVTAETTELRNKDLILRGWHFLFCNNTVFVLLLLSSLLVQIWLKKAQICFGLNIFMFLQLKLN